MSQYAPSQQSANRTISHQQEAARVLGVTPQATRAEIAASRERWTAIVAAEGRSHLKPLIDRSYRTLMGRTGRAQPKMRVFQYLLIGVLLFLTFNLAREWFGRYDLLTDDLRRGSERTYDTQASMWMPLVLLGVTLLTLLPMAAFIWRSLSPKKFRVLASIAYWAAPVLSIAYFFVVGFMVGGIYGAGMTFGFFFLNVLHMATWIANYNVLTKAERAA